MTRLCFGQQPDLISDVQALGCGACDVHGTCGYLTRRAKGITLRTVEEGASDRPAKPTETDPTGRVPHQPGAKLDAGKAPVLRGALAYFPHALAAVAEVSAHGAAKYTWDGWRTVPDGAQRYGDALVRHLLAEADGATDRDSGLRHAAHAAWNALARLELLLDVDADQAR